jgi:hypothetical protein
MIVIWNNNNPGPDKKDLFDCWLDLHHTLRKIPDYEPKPKPIQRDGQVIGQSLYDREKEVPELSPWEYSTRNISETLYISQHTAISQQKRFRAKFGLRNSAGLIRRIFEEQILKPTAFPFIVVLIWSSLFIPSNMLQATTFVWTGMIDNAWHTPSNWNPNAVPSSGDTAMIENAFVTVDMNHAIRKVILVNSQLSISGELNVDSSLSDGIYAENSDIIISSTLRITNAAGVGIFLDHESTLTQFGQLIVNNNGRFGIYNKGQINNFNQMLIKLNDTIGIYIDTGAVFINQDTLIVDSLVNSEGTGIINKSTFINQGDLEIKGVFSGLQNLGELSSFDNQNRVRIVNLVHQGMYCGFNSNPTAFVNTGLLIVNNVSSGIGISLHNVRFENKGILRVKNSEIGITTLANAEFVNDSILLIDTSDFAMIVVQSAYFTNNDSVKISGGNIGLALSGSFSNNRNGYLQLKDLKVNAVELFLAGQLTNEGGEIYFTNLSLLGSLISMENEAQLTNTTYFNTGIIHSDADSTSEGIVEMQDDSRIINHADIILETNSNSGLTMSGNAYFFNGSFGNVLLENVSIDKLKIDTPAVFENEGSFEIK